MQPIGKELRVLRCFCNAKSGTKASSCVTIPHTLNRRLALLPDFTVAEVSMTRYNNLTNPRRSDDDLDRDVWKGLFTDLITSGSDQYDFVILVDVFDECIDSEAAEEFLQFMSRVLKSAANVCLLCSSHKPVNVGIFFAAGDAYIGEDVLEVVNVTAAKNATVIEAFIAGELEGGRRKPKRALYCTCRAKFSKIS